MFFRKFAWVTIFSLLAISLTGCNLGATPAPTVDVNAIYTSAAETAFAAFAQQLTQTAQAASPTPLPTNTSLPTNTVIATLAVSTPLGGATPFATLGIATPIGTLSGPQCDDAAFIADVTVPDGTEMKPGQDFEKVWALQNSGTCRWDEGYIFAWVSGDDLDNQNFEINAAGQFVDPGETANFSIDLTAPLAEREYNSCWRMKSDGGFFFGTFACVKIVVVDD
jgi:hypothetical protein